MKKPTEMVCLRVEKDLLEHVEAVASDIEGTRTSAIIYLIKKALKAMKVTR